MHEMSLAQSLLDLALEHAQGLPITTLVVRVGPLSGVVTESLDFCFEMLSEGTLAEGARLEYDQPPLGIRCRDCGTQVPIETDANLAPYDILAEAMAHGCPACGSQDLRMEGGFDFKLIEIEVKEPQDEPSSG
jgi:hydrogenase nickel incorporation protein HypA/HybF